MRNRYTCFQENDGFWYVGFAKASRKPVRDFELLTSVRTREEARQYIRDHKRGEVCESCNNHGYIEVTHDDYCQYIEACETCDYFGIMEFKGQSTLNDRARDKARKDGLKLTKNGRVKS